MSRQFIAKLLARQMQVGIVICYGTLKNMQPENNLVWQSSKFAYLHNLSMTSFQYCGLYFDIQKTWSIP